MRTFEFPYRIYEGLLLPLIPISLPEETNVYALVDSGAGISLFDATIGEKIGIDITKGKETFLTGIGGRILAYEHIMPIEVVDIKFNCKIAFSYELKVSVNLLGQDDFFDKFIVIFNCRSRTIQLTIK